MGAGDPTSNLSNLDHRLLVPDGFGAKAFGSDETWARGHLEAKPDGTVSFVQVGPTIDPDKNPGGSR